MTTRRKLVASGRGPEVCVTFYVEMYRGKVWITWFDCPFICEAILETMQADSLVELINQTTKEARRYENGAGS